MLQNEIVWLTQKTIAHLFIKDRSVISRHLKNIFKSGELLEDSVCANFAHTAKDGKAYQTKFYNLDVIISVGYRVKPKNICYYTKQITLGNNRTNISRNYCSKNR